MVAAGKSRVREGRILSRVSPSTHPLHEPIRERHAPTARMMAVVPAPSAVRTIIRAR